MINTGPEELHWDDFQGDHSWEYSCPDRPEETPIFYAVWYHSEPYEGWGYALEKTMTNDGEERYRIGSLGHCSCYGPGDSFFRDFEKHIVYTKEEIQELRGKDLNGNEIKPESWGADQLQGLWAALDEAERRGLF